MLAAAMLAMSFAFTACGNLDNPLEELSGGGGSGGSSTINATSLALDAILRLDKTTPQVLTPTVTPSDAAITWESSDEAVATVDATGKVTPIAAGTVTIKATSGDLSATSTVYVYDEIHNINTGGDVTVTSGESWLIEGDKDTPVVKFIQIGNGAKVTLNGINIKLYIDCLGDATITLADGSENTVNVSSLYKAGIKVGPTDKTLTIDAETAGTGKLTVKGGGQAAGIGTNNADYGSVSGGNITINGGTVIAQGGDQAAGIGTGDSESGNNACGDITINGGTVTATGGSYAAGIGTGNAVPGYSQTCGNITIGTGVTSVTATKGSSAPNSIGVGDAGLSDTQTCGTITIDPSANVTQN